MLEAAILSHHQPLRFCQSYAGVIINSPVFVILSPIIQESFQWLKLRNKFVAEKPW